MKRIVALALFCLCGALPLQARELAGLTVTEQISDGAGRQLVLNGAGIRSKFIFKIYVGALYLEEKANSTEAVLSLQGPKQMVMTFLYDEVGRDKLVDGWLDGFQKNLSEEQLARLQPRITTFNTLFSTVKEGDVITLAYQPGQGTRVLYNGVEKGVVPGKDFNDALLKIWLGPEPVTSDLRDELLGKE